MITIAFCILIFEPSPISYATTIDDTLSIKETEYINNTDQDKNNDISKSEKSEEDEHSLDVTKSKEILENKEGTESKEDIGDIDSQENEAEKKISDSEYLVKNIEARLLNLSVLTGTDLNAQLESNNGKSILTLKYEGRSLADLKLLNGMYITFIFPEEIDISKLSTDKIKVTYRDYLLDLPLLPLIPISKEYPSDEIQLNHELNSIGLSFYNFLNLDLLGLNKQSYELKIEFDHILTSSHGELTFGAIGSDGAIVDIDILQGSNYETDTIYNILSPPTAPNLLPIYSNTIVIKGTLPEDFQSSSIIYVYLPDGTQHLAEVSDEEFRLTLDSPLSEGEKVKAVVITETGLESSADTVTVAAMPPPLIIPENLNFGIVTIGSNVSYKFLEEPLEIKVQDTRGTNTQWELQASISQPLTTKSGHILPNALGFYEGEEFKPFTTNELGTGDAITIKTGTTENDEPVTFDWNPKQREGPVIKIDHSAVYAEPYSTEVTWTLVDSVQ